LLGNLSRDARGCFAECCAGAFFEVALAEAGDGNVEALACFCEGFAEEFAFCGVKQRMRGENLCERRERAA
jgi:hypothetical protein